MTDLWPSLPTAEWHSTRDTVHLWTQIVGKVRLALAPRSNHWWNVPLYVNAVGLTTSLMPYRGIGVEVVFDFTAHRLDIQTTSGSRRQMALQPRSVADFYAEFRSHLDALDIDVPINPRPVELLVAIPFPEDTEHASYDAEAMHTFWLGLVAAQRVFTRFRAGYSGKASPVHFFWGAFDLAVSRFSGRDAPPHPGGIPNCPDSVMVEAYRSELTSCGFWPGGLDEGLFYAYAYPAPDGFDQHAIVPREASYNRDLGEFVLPYAAVRAAADPDAYLLEFLADAHEAAVALAGWPTAGARRT